MKYLKSKIFCVLLFCLSFISIAKAGLPDWLKLAQQCPIADSLQESDGVVLHHETSLTVLKSGAFEITERWAIKILSLAGTDYGIYKIHYREGDQIEDVQAFQINKAGKTKRFNQKDFVETSMFKEADVSDDRQLALAFDEPAIGDILAIEYRHRFQPLFYSMEFAFQYSDAPFLFSRLNVTLPPGWRFNYFIPIKPELVKITQTGDVTSWTATNLPAIRETDFLPPLHLIVPSILLSFQSESFPAKTLTTWRAFAQFQNKLWEHRMDADSTIAVKAREITQNQPNLLAKLIKICEFVQQQIRYLSIQIEWGRVVPISAVQTLRNYYGDCKAKSALTISLLSQIGLKAYPVLIMTKDEGTVYPDFVAFQFNHVVIAIPLTDSLKSCPTVQHFMARVNDCLFFDPTAKGIPLGELPWNLQDTRAFVSQPDTAFFVKLPQNPPAAMTEINTIQAKLTANGDLEVMYQERSPGYLGLIKKAYWQEIESKKVKSVLLEHYLDDFAAPSLQDYQIKHSDVSDSATVLKLDFSVPNYARKIQDLWAFKPNLMNAMSARILTQKTRDLPIYFGQPGCIIDTVIITFPPAYQIEEIPTPVVHHIQGIEYSMNCWSRHDTLWYVRHARREIAQVGSADYKSVQQFYENRYLADQQQVVLKFNPQLDAYFLDLKQRAARQPSAVETNAQLADYYYKNNLYSEAIGCYLNLLKTNHHPAMLQYHLSTCYFQLRQYPEALKWAQAAEKAGNRRAIELINRIERQMLVK